MSFSAKETEFLEFDRKVREMDEHISHIDPDVLAAIHNELLTRCEDYRTITGFHENEELIENSPEGILGAIPERSGEDIVKTLFDTDSRASAILRGAVYFTGADFLIRNPDSGKDSVPLMYKGVFINSETWNEILHGQAVLYAMRNKTPEELFGDKFFPGKEVVDENPFNQ